MIHNNINVSNLSNSINFYKEALGLQEVRRINGNGFIIVYLGDGQGSHLLELTQLDSHPQKYDLGENEMHIAFETKDFKGAFLHHKKMGCICYENQEMGLYFISDPDGYWLEILPEKTF